MTERRQTRAFVADQAGFEEFWRAFPRRVGRLAAVKAYERARRSGVSQETLLRGIEQYIRTKPAWQAFCHPTSWLNQGRWLDEPDAPIEQKPKLLPGWECPHRPPCGNSWKCGMKQKAGAA